MTNEAEMRKVQAVVNKVVDLENILKMAEKKEIPVYESVGDFMIPLNEHISTNYKFFTNYNNLKDHEKLYKEVGKV